MKPKGDGMGGYSGAALSVSVVVPVYNGERTIRDCLDSLVQQEFPADRHEIIVVDNNSTDRTCEIVQQYPVKLVHERAIQTSYAARNKGISIARGEIIAFTDADCIASPDWIRALAASFADESVGGVGGEIRDAEPHSDVERFICSIQMFSQRPKTNSFLPGLTTNNAAYRREHLLALGGFNARLYTGADIDLAWRIQLMTGTQVVHTPQAVVYHMHRSTLKSMAKQFRRHGFGEILLDAMYKDRPGYHRTPRRQVARMGSQAMALLTYTRSVVYRTVVWWLRRKDRMYLMGPRYWLVAEGSNLWGKCQGLWATRFFTRNPAEHLWEDPGER